MIVITVARKPLSEGSVAANMVKHGTGGLNIDGCRVGLGGDRTPGGQSGSASSVVLEDGFHKERHDRPTGGRWPANLILGHLPECQCEGEKLVKGSAPMGRPSIGSDLPNRIGPTGLSTRPGGGHTDQNNQETIPDWNCAPGCPVAELDEQSIAGGSHPGGRKTGFHKREGISKTYGGNSLLNSSTEHWGSREYGDTGGASRFFKQVGGK